MLRYLLAILLFTACSDDPPTRAEVCETWANAACEDCPGPSTCFVDFQAACCTGEATCALTVTISDAEIDECTAALKDATCTSDPADLPACPAVE